MNNDLVFPHWCPRCYRDVYNRTTYKVAKKEIICHCGFVLEPISEDSAQRLDKAIKAQVRRPIQTAFDDAHGGIIHTDVLARQMGIDHGLVKRVVQDLVNEGEVEWL